MTSEKSIRKDKNQNIQVFVRLRPLNKRERDIKSLGVVEVVNNREVVVRQSQQTTLTKKFTFDRAFGPHAKQVEVYHDVVSPLITEVLSGYNCTVFAYGQTGTGKTHTMVGEHTSDGTTWQDDPLSGIIPRALSQLFDELRISKMEHTVRVSYLELYNEELFDLLANGEDNSKLRIYEDVTRKGANIVNGLEEITVYNKNEVYKIMAQGQERKRVASTLMNAQSSRSHTVFTIVVHMKENSPEGEEFVKIGKLNLVDLAGSENISKAGSDNPAKRERARECVNINQSLLTLGRVITALVERQPHIPYRESKLTRILQESLGGRTKTSIIATISPGHKDLEETMSTLEYAYRAKNIQNKPEVNQKMTKKAILKEYAEEIDRLKRDLIATRDKNGVYLASETYTEMTLKQEEQKKEIGDLLLHKKAMEEERDKMLNVFNELNTKLQEKETMLDSTIKTLDVTKQKLDKTVNVLTTTKQNYEEQKHLVSKHQETEDILSGQAKKVLDVAQTATQHVKHLHDNVDKRRTIENRNLEMTRAYRESNSHHRNQLTNNAEQYVRTLANIVRDAITQAETHNKESLDVQVDSKTRIEEVIKNILEAVQEMKTLTNSSHETMKQEIKSKKEILNNSLKEHNTALDGLIRSFIQSIMTSISQAETADVEGRGKMENFIKEWLKCNSERLSSVVSTFSDVCRLSKEQSSNYLEINKNRSKQVQSNIDSVKSAADKYMQAITEEKSQIEQKLSTQQKEIEEEREKTMRRVTNYVESERKAFEDRMDKYVEEQKMYLEERLAHKIKQIEEEKHLLEQRLERYHSWYKEHELLLRNEMENNNSHLEVMQQNDGLHCKNIDKVGSLFEQGTSAINIEMEALVQNIMVIMDHVNTNMMNNMYQAKDQVQNDSEKISKEMSVSVKDFSKSMDGIFKNIVNSTKQSMDQFIQNVESNNESTIQSIKTISNLSEEIISKENEHLSIQTDGLKAIDMEANELKTRLIDDVNKMGSLEAKYLKKEYATYTPSGSTPSRQEFQFPRGFAATSPHERILARFRANRQISDEDCMIIESDMSNQCSDSESSTSEDSAVVFVAPSPPEEKHILVNKSTSEGDIFRKTQQGKENTERTSSSTKKPSKLPAPYSMKKPLVERNVS